MSLCLSTLPIHRIEGSCRPAPPRIDCTEYVQSTVGQPSTIRVSLCSDRHHHGCKCKCIHSHNSYPCRVRLLCTLANCCAAVSILSIDPNNFSGRERPSGPSRTPGIRLLFFGFVTGIRHIIHMYDTFRHHKYHTLSSTALHINTL